MGVRAWDGTERIAVIDQKIANIRQAVEDGLGDGKWAHARLAELALERDKTGAASVAIGGPPHINVDTVMEYRGKTEKVFKLGEPALRKRLLRNWVQDVKLNPENLEVNITYRLPEAVMNELVAGEGFEPSTFGL